MSLYQFTLKIDEIVVRDVTERKVIRNTGPNEGDEVSFTAFYGGSNDPEVSLQKRPIYEDYIRFKQGDVKENIDVLSTTINLDDNESAFATVNISDDDDINWISFLGGLGELGKGIFNGVRGILSSDFTAIVQALVEAVQGSIKISEALNEQGAETIAIMNLGIQVKDGRPTFEWKGAFDQKNNVQTYVSQQFIEDNSIQFQSLGKRSNYIIKLSAQFDAATRQAYTTSSLEGSSQSKLLLYGVDAIDGIGNELDNALIGNHANNHLVGLGGQDLLNGGSGQDYLDGGIGIDTMFGGAENDIYEVDHLEDKVVEYLNEGIDAINTQVSYILGEHLENLVLLGFDAIEGTGNSINNLLIGNSAGNRLSGLSGNDQLIGQEGDDVLLGGDGDDQIDGSTGNDVLGGGIGNDTLDGGEGSDTVDLSDTETGVNANLDAQILSYRSQADTTVTEVIRNIENIIGTQFSDTLRGNQTANLLDGGNGNDQIYGELGDDELTGSVGDDLLEGGEGIDAISYRNDPGFVTVNLEARTAKDGFGNIDRLQNIENVIGSAFNDRIIGDRNINVIYAGDGDDRVEARGANDIIYGENGNDTLFGEDGDDLFIGGIGADLLDGGSGNDTASYSTSTLGVIANLSTSRGATGDARGDVYESIENLEGSQWRDRLIGNDNNNSLSGLDGDDFLDGRAGDDQLLGNAGNDDLNGGSGNDILDGAEGDDFLYGAKGNDSLLGGEGDDYLEAGRGDDILNGNDGQDWLEGGSGADHLSGDAGDDALFGSADDDTLRGSSGDDNLDGGTGDDLLAGGTGIDRLDGGEGSDTADLSDIEVGVNADLSVETVNYTDDLGVVVTEVIRNIENIIGTQFGDLLTGNQAANRLEGGNGTDRLSGGNGNDTLLGGPGDDWLAGNAGVDLLDGGDGFDLALLGDLPSRVRANLNTDRMTYRDAAGNRITEIIRNIEGITSGEFNDRLIGDAGNNRFDGRGGNDTLRGRAGNDYFFGGDGIDVIDGGAGFDTVNLIEDFDFGVVANLSTGTLTYTSVTGSTLTETIRNIESVIATQFNDEVIGNSADNLLYGFGGNDRLLGGGGDDGLIGGDGIDFIDGGTGFDTVDLSQTNHALVADLSTGTVTYADATGTTVTETILNIEAIIATPFNDTLIGNDSSNRLNGGGGSDRLWGEAGNDELIGGDGDDILVGGSGSLNILSGNAGSDIFVLASDGFSQVLDFELGTDRIELSEDFTINQLKIEQGTGVNSSHTLIKLASDNTNLMLLKNVQASTFITVAFQSS